MPSKYQSHAKKELVRPYTIHPIWRGIGFLLMVLVPVMALAAALVLTNLGLELHWSFMRELTGKVRLPEVMYTLPVIRNVALWISSIDHLRAKLLFFLAMLLVFSGIMSFLYAAVYRMIGPPRYTALDAPAARVKVKRYTR